MGHLAEIGFTEKKSWLDTIFDELVSNEAKTSENEDDLSVRRGSANDNGGQTDLWQKEELQNDDPITKKDTQD